jgi:hypothetical protein
VAGGLLAVAVGWIPLPVRALIAAALYVVLTVLAATNVTSMPQLNRETEQELLHRGPVVWSMVNSAQLGLGFTSRIGFWSWYLIPIGVALVGDWRAGALIWGGYGATRLAVAVVVAYLDGGPRRLLSTGRALLSHRPSASGWTRLLTVGFAAVLAVVAAM